MTTRFISRASSHWLRCDQLAFEQLKKRLEAEGLFAAERKKSLPVLETRYIGRITSPKGAAVRDVVRILKTRFPNVYLTLYPVRVQGEGAAGEIVRALQYFNRRQGVDVVILARGGGSMEDLWSFNEEIVARAIAASTIAIISGVGHETDFTIADFVADVRASTPSSGGGTGGADAPGVRQTHSGVGDNLTSLMRYRVSVLSRRVHELAARRGFRRPLDLLQQNRQRSDQMTSRLAMALRARLEYLQTVDTAHVRIVGFDFHKQVVRTRDRVNESAARIELALRALELGKPAVNTLRFI